jgi:hypothetical protein
MFVHRMEMLHVVNLPSQPLLVWRENKAAVVVAVSSPLLSPSLVVVAIVLVLVVGLLHKGRDHVDIFQDDSHSHNHRDSHSQ